MSSIDPGRFYDLTIPATVRVSPSGDRIAVIVHEFDSSEPERIQSLYVLGVDGSDRRRISRASSVSTPRWRPDGEAVAVTATRDPPPGHDGESADGDPTKQVWSFDLSGGDPQQLTDVAEGVEAFDWAPDGERLVVAARDGGHTDDTVETGGEYPRRTDRLQYKFMSGWRDPEPSKLFVVDTAAGTRRRLSGAASAGVLAPQTGLCPRWSPDSERIAFLTNRTDDPDRSRRMDVYTVPVEGGEPTRVSEGKVLASTPHWSPDGERLAYRVEDPENPYIPTTVQVADCGGEPTEIVGEADGPVRDAHWLDEGRIATLLGAEGETVLAIADTSSGSLSYPGSGTHQGHPGRIHAAGGTFAACLSSVGTPAEVFTVDEEATQVTGFSESFSASTPIPPTRRIDVQREDAVVDTQVAFPPGYDPDDGDPLPTVTELHGGPMTYDAPTFDFGRLFWTTRGYALVRVNYRGSTSFGRQFAEAGRGTWNGPEVTDVLAAVDEVEDRGWADPDRQFLTGYSQGGIVTAYLATATDRFAAVAPERGIYDFRAAFGSGDMHSWYTAEFGMPWENPEQYDRISSITDVSEIDTPTLVIACEFDERCPPEQAEQLYVSLTYRSVPTRLVVYDETHFLVSPVNTVDRLKTLREWFEAHDPVQTASDTTE